MFERWFGKAEGSLLIQEAFEDVSSMLRQSSKMLDLAVGALLENRELDTDLDALDDVVDEGERRVRRADHWTGRHLVGGPCVRCDD